MKTLLRNKQIRINFLIAVACILAIIITVHLIIGYNYTKDVPIWVNVLIQILDSLFVSLVVSVTIGGFLFYIELPEEEKKFEIIEPFKIDSIFERERSTTDIWFFSGGTGRFTRGETLPKLADISKRNNHHISIKILIIDPTNYETCKKYSEYRNGLRSADNRPEKWSGEYVKQEAAATLITALIYNTNYPHLDITVGLKSTLSTLRIDLSSKTAVVTKEDKREPALICTVGSFLYRTYKEEILQTLQQYEQINTTLNDTYKLDNIDATNIIKILKDIGLYKGISHVDAARIAKKINNNKNPHKYVQY